MAVTIRPDMPVSQRPDVPRNAGQRAFFEAVMGKSATVEASSAPLNSTGPVNRMPTSLPAEPPSRILRPGSLLDIRV